MALCTNLSAGLPALEQFPMPAAAFALSDRSRALISPSAVITMHSGYITGVRQIEQQNSFSLLSLDAVDSRFAPDPR
jgi:hypothetical protein